MKVVELRVELKSRGLPVGGLKAELIQRLHDYEKSAAHDDEGGKEEPGQGVTSTAGATKPAKGSAKAEVASPVEDKKSAPDPAAAAPEAGGTSAAAPVLKSTRSKTRRASMANTAAAAAAAAATTPTKSPAKAAEVSGKAGTPATKKTSGGEAAAAAGGGGAAGAGGAVDENSEMNVTLAKGAGLLGLGISAACIGWGHGLTAGNLAMLHMALAGVFISATAANTRPTGVSSFIARAVVTLAVAFVASEALRQLQQPLRGAPVGAEAGAGAQSGMASLLALVSGARGEAPGCDAVAAGVGGEGAGGGVGEVACLEASSTALGVLMAWVTAAWSVLEAGDWRAVRFGLIEFWGWASVAGYVALVKALPVMLQPLHGVFRRLERGHNIALAVTSAAMLVGIVHSCITSGKTSSVQAMLCAPFDETDPVFDLTSKVFFWSKAWEWFDTALLVAKGKPVSWLQYTHHASTAILTALNMVPMRNAMWSVVCSLNSFVHTWMYAYYGFPRFRLLRRSKVFLTWAQMLQHMIVLASATYVVYLSHTGAECHNNATPILAGLGLYGMYLAFFALFYRRTYGGAKKKSKAISSDCSTKWDMAGSDVVLLMGQSNMSGRGRGYDAAIDGPNNPRIKQWTRANTVTTASERLEHADFVSQDSQVGMGTAFGRAYVENLPPQRSVLLVPTASGGAALVDGPWSPGGQLFEDAVDRMKAALASNEAKGNCVAAILWHQGEDDARNSVDRDAYESSWKDMASELRSRIPAAAEAPVILGEFTDKEIERSPDSYEPILAAVRAIPAAVSWTAVASSNGLESNPGDDLHFSAAAQREYGRRYYDKLVKAVENE
eukprot:g11482.t1